jgi:hypothetical protein
LNRWKRSGLLKDTKEESNSQETSIVLDQGSESHDDAPTKDDAAHVPRWSLELVKDHVGRDFAEDEGDEEDSGDYVVPDALEVQVVSHAFDLCISYHKSVINIP